MAEIFYVQRGKKKYAYRSTSKYEPGKKYPVTVNEYIGVLNEETGEIIPKKSRMTQPNLFEMKELCCRRFGGSYALLNVAENISLREDLFYSFGPDGERLLACAVAQALSGGPFSSSEETIDGCLIRELQGIGGSFASPRLSEFTKCLGESYGSLESLFERRLRRSEGALSYDLTSTSTHGTMKEWAEWGHNRDGERMRQLNIGLVTDKHGVPAMFEIYPGSIADLKTLERTVDRVQGIKGEACTLVMDRGFGSASNLEYMLDKGIAFVIPGKRSTRCVKELMSRLIKRLGDCDMLRIHGGRNYTVLEEKVAVVRRERKGEDDDDSNDTKDFELVLSDDPRFAEVPEGRLLTAHVCYDAKRAAEDTNDFLLALKGIEDRLSGMDPWAAVRDLKQVAGGYARYFDLEVREGKLSVERKRNAISFSMNRNGMFVMFSRGVGAWEDMMSCYDCRTYVEQAFDVLKNELDGSRWRTADPMTAKGRLVVKFVALMVWCSIAATLRDNNVREPVRTVLQSLDNIMAVGHGVEWRVLEVTKRNRGFLSALRIQKPDERQTLPASQYIPQSAIETAKEGQKAE